MRYAARAKLRIFAPRSGGSEELNFAELNGDRREEEEGTFAQGAAAATIDDDATGCQRRTGLVVACDSTGRILAPVGDGLVVPGHELLRPVSPRPLQRGSVGAPLGAPGPGPLLNVSRAGEPRR